MEKNDRDYSNGEITVHWRPSACIHSTICYSKLREVFNPAKRPWVNMKGASTEEIIDIVNQCPTDALTFSWDKEDKSIKKENLKENREYLTNVSIIENGPAILSGNFEITDIKGNKLAKADTISLCRCGNSSKMPFCDGTHNHVGFKEKRD